MNEHEHDPDEPLEPPTPEAQTEAERLADKIRDASYGQPPAHPYDDDVDDLDIEDDIQNQT